jgi:FtsH-binding integral membrane protein
VTQRVSNNELGAQTLRTIIIMIQRVIDSLTAFSIRSKSLSVPSRIFRIALLLAILAIPTLLCGFLVNFKVAFQMWLFVLAAIVPLVIGFFLIGKYQGNNEKTAFLLVTGLIGFVAFELSLLGMLMDERSSNFSWAYILSNAVEIGFAFFIISTLSSLLFTLLFRVTNNKK